MADPKVEKVLHGADNDIMLLKRQKLGAIQLAKDCNLDGVEVDLGSLGKRPDFVNELRKPEIRQSYLDACQKTGIEICSIAMTAFFGQSFTDHPRADAFTQDLIETMQNMHVKTAFIPIRPQGDLKTDAKVRAGVVSRHA